MTVPFPRSLTVAVLFATGPVLPLQFAPACPGILYHRNASPPERVALRSASDEGLEKH